MDGQQQHRPYFGTSFHGIVGHRAKVGAPITRDPLHIQAPPKERQTVIDGFFEPIPDTRSTSEYFQGGTLLSAFDDQDILALYEAEAVPTFPEPSVGMQYGPKQNQHEQKLGPSLVRQHPHAPTVQVAQMVPTIGYTAGRQQPRPTSRSTKTVMAKWKGSKAYRHQQDQDVDLSEVHAGGVRLRSIQFCKSIHDVVDGSVQSQHLPASDLGAPSVALVEVVASPMCYQNYCWEFTVRDPTTQDFARKYPIAPSPNPCIAISNLNLSPQGTRTLRCRMYDLDNSVDQDALERDEILRIVGIIVTQEQVPGACQDNGLHQIQCVGIRSAFVDEVRTTIQESHRGPPQGQI
ncbi:hypothetical protein EDD21DRAFT_414753 [Dissophora ornata]|nr:hypothetical protein EDD21DRAFT_414753 [Dissophora ornata]